jgi:hypothetical protein
MSDTDSASENVAANAQVFKLVKKRRKAGPGSRKRANENRRAMQTLQARQTQGSLELAPDATQQSDTSQPTKQSIFHALNSPKEVDSADESQPWLECFPSAQEQEAIFHELGLDEDLVSVSAEDWPWLQDIEGNPTITFYGVRSSARSVNSLNPEENGTFGKEHLESSRTGIHIILSWNVVLE